MSLLSDEVHVSGWALATQRGSTLRGVRFEPREGIRRSSVLIAPGFCQTMVSYAPLARYLARLGFTVYRFDLTDHAGISDGEMPEARLTKFVRDIRQATEHVMGLEGECHVIAASLSARAAFRAFAESGAPRPNSITGLLPVVDFRFTVDAAVGRDLVAAEVAGLNQQLTFPLWGYDVPMAVISDAVEANLHTVSSTVEDIRRLSPPVTLIGGADDDIVSANDLAAVAEAVLSPERLMLLQDLAHRSINPPALRAIAQAIGRDLISGASNAATAAELDDRNLSMRELRETIVFERGWLRAPQFPSSVPKMLEQAL